jgi:GNAT superfamily N-acetyltransferase
MTADHAAKIASGSVWVAVDRRDEPIGVLVLARTRTSLLLENVAVAPEHQRRGIGRALIGFAEDRARDVDLPEVTLYTNEQMIENLALYPRLGYDESGRRSDEGFARVFFRKRLV